MVLNNLLTILKLLLKHVQIQVAQVALNNVDLARFVDPPTLVEAVVGFPYADGLLVMHAGFRDVDHLLLAGVVDETCLVQVVVFCYLTELPYVLGAFF